MTGQFIEPRFQNPYLLYLLAPAFSFRTFQIWLCKPEDKVYLGIPANLLSFLKWPVCRVKATSTIGPALLTRATPIGYPSWLSTKFLPHKL